MRTIYKWEPWVFIFFGIFHMHRIWAFADSESYALFWLGVLRSKGLVYFLLMGVLSVLCILGIITFFRERGHNYWWRLIYLFGGSYLLFDLFAIAAGLGFWQKLLEKMFDPQTAYWNAVWGFFILMGALVFALGITLLVKVCRNKQSRIIAE